MQNSKLAEIFGKLENKNEYGDQESTNSTFVTSHSLPSITIGDGRFYLKKTPSSSPVDLGTSIDCSLLLGHPEKGNSRVFFEGDYTNTPKHPTCQSNDGLSPSIANPVSSSCKTCPKAQFGSGKNGKGTACRTMKTLYLVLMGEEQLLSILRISGKTLVNLQGHVEEFTELDLAVSKFVTTLSIDQESKFPVIEFGVKEAFGEDDFEALQDYIEIAMASIQ